MTCPDEEANTSMAARRANRDAVLPLYVRDLTDVSRPYRVKLEMAKVPLRSHLNPKP